MLVSFPVYWDTKHLTGHSGFGHTLLFQVLDGPPLLFSCRCWHVGRERLWRWLYPLCMTQQYHLASMAAWLSSTDISPHSLLPHVLSICPFNLSLHSQQQPAPWDCSTIPKLQLPVAVPFRGPRPCLGYVCLRQGLSDSHSI